MNYQQKRKAYINACNSKQTRNNKAASLMKNQLLSQSNIPMIYKEGSNASTTYSDPFRHYQRNSSRSVNSIKQSTSHLNTTSKRSNNSQLTMANASLIQAKPSSIYNNQPKRSFAIPKSYSNASFFQMGLYANKRKEKPKRKSMNDNPLMRDREIIHKRNSFISTDFRLNSLESIEDNLSINSASFPKELCNAMSLNKYKIMSLTDLTTNNTTTIGIGLNNNVEAGLMRSLSPAENNFNFNKKGKGNDAFPELEITTNNFISDLSDNDTDKNDDSNKDKFIEGSILSKYQIKPKDNRHKNNKNNNNNGNNDTLHSTMDNMSPVIGYKNNLNNNLLEEVKGHVNANATANKNLDQSNNILPITPNKSSNRHHISKDIKTLGIEINPNKTNTYNNKIRTHCSMPNSVKNIQLGSFNNDRLTHTNNANLTQNNSTTQAQYDDQRIPLINFLSVPRIMNLIISKGKASTLIPCVFIIVPSCLCSAFGIESYCFNYNSIQNTTTYTTISNSIDIIDISCCLMNHFNPLQFSISVITSNDTITDYYIEAPSIDLRVNYVKGLNHLIALQRNPNKRR